MDDKQPQETSSAAFYKLLVCTILMFSAPFISYFTFKKYIFEDLMGYPPETSILLAVIPAVLSVNIIIAFYIYLAWNSEPFHSTPQENIDPDKSSNSKKEL